MSSEKVLIVEDDVKLSSQLQELFSTHGFTTKVAGSAEDGLDKVERERPDLVVLDISLPGIDGLTACRTLCGQLKLPVILLTASDAPELKITALGIGADDYVTKP